MKKTLILFIVALGVMIQLSSCKKGNEPEPSNKVSTEVGNYKTDPMYVDKDYLRFIVDGKNYKNKITSSYDNYKMSQVDYYNIISMSNDTGSFAVKMYWNWSKVSIKDVYNQFKTSPNRKYYTDINSKNLLDLNNFYYGDTKGLNYQMVTNKDTTNYYHQITGFLEYKPDGYLSSEDYRAYIIKGKFRILTEDNKIISGEYKAHF